MSVLLVLDGAVGKEGRCLFSWPWMGLGAGGSEFDRPSGVKGGVRAARRVAKVNGGGRPRPLVSLTHPNPRTTGYKEALASQ